MRVRLESLTYRTEKPLAVRRIHDMPAQQQ